MPLPACLPLLSTPTLVTPAAHPQPRPAGGFPVQKRLETERGRWAGGGAHWCGVSDPLRASRPARHRARTSQRRPSGFPAVPSSPSARPGTAPPPRRCRSAQRHRGPRARPDAGCRRVAEHQQRLPTRAGRPRSSGLRPFANGASAEEVAGPPALAPQPPSSPRLVLPGNVYFLRTSFSALCFCANSELGFQKKEIPKT